ncbi:hypothetical protein I4U23_028858 [Adineta vaga]|nr:hypothetical protein I4U23_028858 [Adineta vaga]
MLSTKISEKASRIPLPRHLWSNDTEVTKIRRQLIIYWIRSSVLFWILILLIALIYLGSGVNPIWHTESLDVFVTNFDDGRAGSYFLEAFHNTPSGNQTLNWIFQQPSDLSSSIDDQIEDGKAWASVFMNPNISNRLNRILQSILNGNLTDSVYQPSSAVTIVYDEGRNFNTINGYVLPPIRAAIAVASVRYASYLQSQITQYSNMTPTNIIAAISLANKTYLPISYTNKNLHPATPYAGVLATSLGYLFLWLIMLSLVGMAIRITQPLAGKIKIIDIVFIRIINTIFNGLIISLIYSLCVLWFANFTKSVPFIRFWLFNWLATVTFTVIISLFVINLGALAQIALTLFLIINLSASSTNITIELQNRFYHVGYGLPLYHCFSAGRHLLFGSYTKLNVDIAVLFAFYFGAVILTIITGIYRMYKQEQKILEQIPWCSKLPRPQYSLLERVTVPSQKWFEVYRIRPTVFAIYEPYHWEESISYLVIGSQSSLLIDTGMGIENIRKIVEFLIPSSTSLKVINTHTHHDHVGDNWRFSGSLYGIHSEFAEQNAKGMIWEKYLPKGFNRKTYRIHPFQINNYVKEGDRIILGHDHELEIISTPGHAPDSISFLDEKQRLLFVGDTFYQGPILLYRPETNLQDYLISLEKLAKMTSKVDLYYQVIIFQMFNLN